jgi:hypothetical protein
MKEIFKEIDATYMSFQALKDEMFHTNSHNQPQSNQFFVVD